MASRTRIAVRLRIVIAIATVCGCSSSFRFAGRLLILNATDEDLQYITLIIDGQEIQLSETATEQAWLKRVKIYRSLAFRWRANSGDEVGASEPLEELLPENTRGDLLIKLVGPGSLKIVQCKLPDELR